MSCLPQNSSPGACDPNKNTWQNGAFGMKDHADIPAVRLAEEQGWHNKGGVECGEAEQGS